MILPHDQLRRQLERAYQAAYPDGPAMEISVERTTDPKHGDYASTVAMKLAPVLHLAPREIAQYLLAKLGSVPMLERAEVIGAGYINFFLKPQWLLKQPTAILADRRYGQNNSGKNRRLLLEFVSANPTGPVTLGNGRAAFAGSALSNILAHNGWRVTREYYINDAGNQANILAESVIRRYFQAQGIPTEYPDYCYQGEYVKEVAAKLKIDKLKLQDMMTIRDRIKVKVLNLMIDDHKRVMKQAGVVFDSWFRESVLHDRKTDVKALAILDDHALLYQKEEATWFKTTAFGDEKDRVVVKKDGTLTYLVADVALRWNRFAERKFEHEIIFLGADHHGYVKRLEAAAAALGFARRVEVRILQFVRLMEKGQEVKMSKRAGTFVTLDELVNDVGPDVARFFFLMYAADSHMDFNLDLAKEKSEKNPVYYVQYAHARIVSLLKKVKKLPVQISKDAPHASELKLVKLLMEYPRLIAEIGQSRETQKLPFYTIDLARAFHEFYTFCRVIDQDHVWAHRLRLVEATQKVLADALGVMGVKAPEKM